MSDSSPFATLRKEELNDIAVAIQGSYAGTLTGHPALRDLVRLDADVRRLREAAARVIDNHEAVLATHPADGTPLVVAHWIAIDRLKAALGRGSEFDAEAAAAGLEQIMLVRLGKANQKADRLRELLQRAAYALSNSGAYLGFEHAVAAVVDAVERELAGEGG